MTAEERVTQSRRAQGLPDRVEDSATLARVAQLLRDIPVNDKEGAS